MYAKEYLPEEDKPVVYIKYENVSITTDDNEILSTSQWIVYREFCASEYYLYCEHSQNTSDIALCSGKWHTSWGGTDRNITSTANTTSCGTSNDNEDRLEDPVPISICMANTGSSMLDGRYEAKGTLNDRTYYTKQYTMADPLVYIKFSGKWIVYKSLNDEESHTTYFLECDANIDSVDVTDCDGHWIGDPNKTPDNVRSTECMETFGAVLRSADPETMSMVVTVVVIVAFLIMVGCGWWICGKPKRKRHGKRHRFNKLSDDDADDMGGEEDSDSSSSLGDLDDKGHLSSPGGGTKTSKRKEKAMEHVMEWKKKTIAAKRKIQDALAKRARGKVGGAVVHAEAIPDGSDDEFVGGKGTENGNGGCNGMAHDNQGQQPRNEYQSEEEVDEFTSSLVDYDEEEYVDEANDADHSDERLQVNHVSLNKRFDDLD